MESRESMTRWVIEFASVRNDKSSKLNYNINSNKIRGWNKLHIIILYPHDKTVKVNTSKIAQKVLKIVPSLEKTTNVVHVSTIIFDRITI